MPQRLQVVRWRGALEGLLPPDHLARFVWQVLSSFDFSEVEACYRSTQAGPGRSPYHPRLLAALWVYGMTQGLETAAAIAQACRIRDDFRWLAGGLCPSDQTLLNFLSVVPDGLGSIWGQVLGAMHQAGHIDLSAVVEDGTKLQANASPRSFHTATEIKDIIAALQRQLAAKLQELGEQAHQPAHRPEVRALQGRIQRATRAAAELQQRMDRRRPDRPGPSGAEAVEPGHSTVAPAAVTKPPKFERSDFHHHAERDALVCPAGKRLPFLGIYREPPRDSYRLYRAEEDCGTCALKARCTEAPRRRVKIPSATLAQGADPPSCPPGSDFESSAGVVAPDTPAVQSRQPPRGPQASITEPEAVMMLATSQKRWQPSYNADLTVTRHEIIVNQFLTKDTTDYAAFGRALPAVLATLGRPEAWIGDGHYGTQENVLLAHRAGVVLYAPPAGSGHDDTSAPSTGAADGTASTEAAANHVDASGDVEGAGEARADRRARDGHTEQVGVEAPPARTFCRRDFRHDPDRDLLICPAGETLPLIGVYAERHRAAYRIYGRRHCGTCSLKPQCTRGRGRRVKLRRTPTASSPSTRSQTANATNDSPSSSTLTTGLSTRPGEVTELVQALAARMREIGDRIKTFRSLTIEPVNAQLKQHGLGRFHVHGLGRCSTVLTLGCIAHNLMKWKAREAARVLSAVA